MVSKQTVQILIEAQENVSKVAKKAEDALNKMGKAGSQGMSKLTSFAGKIQNGFSKLSSFVDRARERFTAFTNSSNKLGMIRNTISNAATSFGQLISSSNLAASAMEKIKSVSDGVQAKFTDLKSKITSFGSSVKSTLTNAFSLGNIKAKLSNLGSSIDNLKARLKSLAAEAKKTGGSGGLGFLKNAASMTVGMLGYDLVNSVIETTRASLNARSGMQAFAQRLNMSGAEVQKFQSDLDNMQTSFKKIDMDVVGQQATDMAYRLGLPKQSLTELTETTAIFNDAMMRNGRSAEDSMLAMSDAMDGQFVRLKEIGISQEDLMKNGWSGDINDKTGLLKAMNKALKDQHYDELAKSVDTLDDAWQVLNITMGNLLEQILVPLTPTIVAIISGIGDAITGIMGFVNTLKTAFSGLPDWQKDIVAIGLLSTAFIGLAVVMLGTVLPAILASASGFIAYVAGALGVKIANMSLAASFWAVASAVLANPLTWVVVALVAIAVAAYEVGKAFGWWSDVGSMFEAIGAGLQRMWDAFINHPDVQAAISAISGALQWLTGAIGNAFNAILKFFGVSTGSKWDIVADIINAIGFVWEIFSGRIKFAIGVVQTIIGIFGGLYDALTPIGSFIMDVFSPVFSGLLEIFGTIYSSVSSLIGAFQAFQDGQVSLPGLIMMVWNTLVSMFTTIISTIVTMVFQFVDNLTGGALTAGRNFVTGIINWIRQLPGRVYNYLVQVWTRITTTATRWVTTARTKASQLVTGVISFLSSLPGKAFAALIGVVSKIISAGSQWISNAGSKAKGIVDAVKNKLTSLPSIVYNEFMNIGPKIFQAGSDLANKAANAAKKIVDDFKRAAGINSPGYIQIAMVKEFSDMVDRVAEYENPAGKVAGKVASSMVKGFGKNPIEEEVAIDGITGKQFNIANGKYISNDSATDNVDVNIKGDMDLNINLSGLPDGVSTSEVTSIFEDLFNDPTFKNNFMREIAKSAIFQNEDNKQKAKITAKNKRARGI